MLNLAKGEALNLTKADGSVVSKIRVGLSWDAQPQNGADVDIDLFVVQKAPKTVAYFGAKTAISGVKLGGDNLTGAGEGDDETAEFDANVTVDGDYVVAINIYSATSRGQKFSGVSNLSARVYNAETNEVLVEYKVTENGGDHTALIVGTITDVGNSYKFTANGTFLNGDINDVAGSL